MTPLDPHQRAATAVAVAADELNRALVDADRAGLLVGLVLMDASDRPNVRRLVAQCSVPVPVPATAEVDDYAMASRCGLLDGTGDHLTVGSA